MYFRFPAPLAVVVALAGLAGCSGGGGSVGTATLTCAGTDPNAFCLNNCSLGCSSTGCLRSDIAQNEQIILQFTRDVDPASVNSSTIQFRTASGDQPVGDFFVNGNQVEFVPSLRISGGQSFYGFTPGETYTMTLPGGPNESATVRSTSGQPFTTRLTCTIISNQGIVDLNGVPPRATLLSPTSQQLGSAPRDVQIQLQFNEIIDATPFLGGTSTSPVIFSVRRTRDNGQGGRECDSSSQPVALVGTQRLDFQRDTSILTFTPAALLPGNVCVEVNVTDGVVDLSGKPAQPQLFQFLTEQVPLTEEDITEEFVTSLFLDADASAAVWGNGQATFAQIGGDGRHGTFDVSLGNNLGLVNGKRTFEINCDNTIIPAANTITGSAVAITDGRFFFDKMVVPSDVRLRFIGNNPPVITVAGRLDLQGEIDVAGQSLTTLPPNTQLTGQVGGLGGIFGGNGGQGGDKCLGTGFNPNYNGRSGGAVRVLGSHAYANSVAGTGGTGSTLFPANGLSTSLLFVGATVAFTPSAAAGGGGGGLLAAGGQGRVVMNNYNDPVAGVPPRLDVMGAPAPGGSAMTLFPFPAATGSTKSSVHFLVGGAGGGGAGSHACLAIAINRVWSPGGGGGGGGGAIALRAGDSLRVGPLGRILATGGSAAGASGLTSQSSPAPGGGGSGGSVVLQSGRDAEFSGPIDVRGGNGGIFNRFANQTALTPPTTSVQIEGGNGSPGFVRCEVPGNPTTALLASMQPPATAENVAPLAETDDLVSCRSTFYSTNLLFGPEFARYEIHATVDGVPTIFSDDPAVSTLPAQVGSAVRAWWQAANLDLATNQPIEVRQWRTSVRTSGNQVGIASDGLNGFRFLLVVDRAIAQSVTIDKVVVVYRIG